MNKLAYNLGTQLALKIAGVTTKLQPHQQRVINRISKIDQPGLVVAHGLGSGKTLTAISAADALGLPADVVVPASLQENFRKEIRKHTRNGAPKLKVQSLQNITTKHNIPKRQFLIVDEAHRLRDPSTESFKNIAQNTAAKRLLLTGSPLYNRPSDISPLVDLAAGSRILPLDSSEFNDKYVTNKEVKPRIVQYIRGLKPGKIPELNKKNKKELSAILNRYIDYYPGSTENYPSVKEEEIKVPMTPEQLKYYDTAMGTAPYWVRAKILHGLPPTKSEASQLNAYLGAVRQISNTTKPFHSEGEAQEPKIQRAYSELENVLKNNPKAKAVIYSNFLQAGIDPYKAKLEAGHIPYGEFTGRMSHGERDRLVKDYNANKIRALLLSSAGGEGLDLKGTRLMQILEPHWNSEKLKQVKGRGVRYKSHEELPSEERNVLIQNFLASRPRSGILEKLKLKNPGLGVDEYLTNMSKNKELLNQQFKDLLEQGQTD